MRLGHVYIVFEPVGSARLTFDDDLYYELCDLMTEVCSESRIRSRTYEESQNGREVKIHILEGCIRTSEWFRVIQAFFRSTGRLPEPPGKDMGLMGHRREANQPTRGWCAPPWAGGRLGLG